MGQNTTQIQNGTTRTGDSAHTTAEAFAFIDNSNIVFYMDSVSGTYFFAHTTSDAADLTDNTGILAFVVVGTFHCNEITAVMNVDQILRTVRDAFATGNTLVFVHLCYAQIIDVDCIKFTRNDTLLTADASVDAFRVSSFACSAAAVASYKGSFIGKLLLKSHNSFPPSYFL